MTSWPKLTKKGAQMVLDKAFGGEVPSLDGIAAVKVSDVYKDYVLLELLVADPETGDLLLVNAQEVALKKGSWVAISDWRITGHPVHIEGFDA
jgi:hypothetical protein